MRWTGEKERRENEDELGDRRTQSTRSTVLPRNNTLLNPRNSTPITSRVSSTKARSIPLVHRFNSQFISECSGVDFVCRRMVLGLLLRRMQVGGREDWDGGSRCV